MITSTQYTAKQLTILDWMSSIGIENQSAVAKAFPPVLGYSLENNIKPQVAYLESIGVKNPGKVIEAFPQVLGLSLENNIKPQVVYLESIGVKNPGKVIEAFPQVLSLSLESNIKPQVAYLESIGVKNPGKVIEAFPSVLGLSLENKLKPTIELMQKLDCHDVESNIATLSALCLKNIFVLQCLYDTESLDSPEKILLNYRKLNDKAKKMVGKSVASVVGQAKKEGWIEYIKNVINKFSRGQQMDQADFLPPVENSLS